MSDDDSHDSEGEQFSRLAEERQPGFFSEFWSFLRGNKKWWLTPILIVLLLLIAFVVLSNSPLAPLLYPLF